MTNLKELCENWDGSTEGFGKIIEAYLHLNLSSKILAAEFEVAPSTINRWASLVTAPLPRMQKLIVDYLLNYSR